jgi:hypothetical protein
MVMNFRVPHSAKDLTSWVTTGSSRRALLDGVRFSLQRKCYMESFL